MRYEVAQDRKYPSEWVAEAFDEEGFCFMVRFSGPQSETRAREYAAWKNDEVFVVMRPSR